MARETINGISVPIPGTGEPADFVGDLRQIATDLSASTAQSIQPGQTDPQVAVDARVALEATARTNAIAALRRSDFAGLAHVAYLNSYGNPQAAAGNTDPWPLLLATAHGGSYVNRSQNGNQMQDTVQEAIGRTGRVWANGDGALVVITDPINDAGRQQADAQALLGFKEALRAMLHLLRSSSRVDSSLWTTSGAGWTTYTQPGGTTLYFSGGSILQGNAGAGTVNAATSPTFTTTRPNEVVGILTYVKVDATGAQIAVQLDGVDVATKDCANIGRKSQDLTRDYIASVIPVIVPTAGTHNVSLTRTGGGNLCYVDALLRMADIPPTILVPKAVRPTDESIVSFYGAGKSDAARALYNAAIDEVVAEFPKDGRVVVVDANALRWAPATDQSSDGLHPSAAGMQKLLYAARLALHEVM